MTSAAPSPAPQQPSHQQQQRQQQQPQNPNVPNPPSTPVATHIQAAVSPPNKRDLKSWWKGFKLPSKHHEAQGTTTPSILRFTGTKNLHIYRGRGWVSTRSRPTKHRVRRRRPVQRASASLSPPPLHTPTEAPKLGLRPVSSLGDLGLPSRLHPIAQDQTETDCHRAPTPRDIRCAPAPEHHVRQRGHLARRRRWQELHLRLRTNRCREMRSLSEREGCVPPRIHAAPVNTDTRRSDRDRGHLPS